MWCRRNAYIENVSAAFLKAVWRSMPSIRQVLASVAIDPALLTSAKRIQHDGFLRRREGNKIVNDMAKADASIRGIIRRTGRCRRLIRGVLRGEDGNVFRNRSNTLDDRLVKIGTTWDAGCHNVAEL